MVLVGGNMKVLTKNTDYAIRSLIYCAKDPDRFISSREISQQEKIPLAYARRIFQVLKGKNILMSQEGVKGGVRLALHPDKIRVGQIIRIFQNDITLSQCLFRKKICPNRPTCVLRVRIKQIEKKVSDEFEKITIQDLLNDIGNM